MKETNKKSRCLDLKSLYESESSKEGAGKSLKRKGGGLDSDGENNKRKKSTKALSISRLKNVTDNGSKLLEEVYNASLTSVLHDSKDSKLCLSQKSNGSGVFSSISLTVEDDVKIPRRKRGIVRRRKIENGGEVLKLEDKNDKLGDADDVGSKGTSVLDHVTPICDDKHLESSNLKLKNRTDNFKENTNGESNSGRDLKEKDAHADVSIVKKGESSSKNSLIGHSIENAQDYPSNGSLRKRSRKRKNKVSDIRSPVKGEEPSGERSIKLVDNVGRQDEEENLEENAARMLSSRFDPSCTESLSKNKVSSLRTKNGLRYSMTSKGFVGRGTSYVSGSDSASGDTAVRVLRPRKQFKEKDGVRKRRHFYEIVCGELDDAYWVLNRRIKVFWPLDESWYYGLVNDYDVERKLHHVKYDDRDEEWIDLQNERFKLLLFPSEAPGRNHRKKSVSRRKQSIVNEASLNRRKYNKRKSTAEDGRLIGNHMDSEPIISWLDRSSRRVKSSPVCATKENQSNGLSSFGLPLTTVTSDGSDCRGMGSLIVEKAPTHSNSTISERLASLQRNELCATGSPLCTKDGKLPLVYYRRRFRKKKNLSCHVSEVDHLSTGAHDPDSYGTPLFFEVAFEKLVPVDSLWSIDSAGSLKLNFAMILPRNLAFKLSCPLPSFQNRSFSKVNTYLCRAILVLQFGKLMTMLPRVQLEMLIIDNVVGLRFLLFEGCLKQAVAFVFVVLNIFGQPDEPGKSIHLELPVTSIRFKLSCTNIEGKQLVYLFFKFSEVENSRWTHLEHKMNKHCLLTQQLPLSQCTYNNIKELQNGSNGLLTYAWRGTAKGKGSCRRSRQRVPKLRISAKASGSFNPERSQNYLPPTSLSITATPTFFLGLHRRLLMEHTLTRINFRDEGSMEDPETSSIVGEPVSMEGLQLQPSDSDPHKLLPGPSVAADGVKIDTHSSLPSFCNGITVEIPSPAQVDKHVSGDSQVLEQTPDLSWNLKSGIIPSPNPTARRSTWHRNRNSSASSGSCAHGWSEGRADFLQSGFGNRLKKPRTRVNYALPFGDFDPSSRGKGQQHKMFSHKRFRTSNEKRSSDNSTASVRNLELLSCDVNLLLSVGDKGWRECGLQVVLELFDHNEWRLAVKLSGTTKYSYKPHQVLQPGSTNRFTHALMWKGGKEWVLEFPDRSQWALFKEMHEECYNRNVRAALVKNIPIPGVRLVEENDDHGTDAPFLRSPKYFCQIETDVQMALNPSRVMYDIDSDDERWMSEKYRSAEVQSGSSSEISEEMFEKVMDMFEKAAYSQQRDCFTAEEVEDLMSCVGSMEVVKMIYEYWHQKRNMKRMPLIRHLQPPRWEQYQEEVREWEKAKAKSIPSNGCCKVSQNEKPPMFAFCMKPRGLQLLHNRGLKHRAPRKLSVAGQSNTFSLDHDGFHAYASRRLNGFASADERVLHLGHSYESMDDSPLPQRSPRFFSLRDADAGSVGYYYSNGHRYHLQRSKSKKVKTPPYPTGSQMPPSFNNRMFDKRNDGGWTTDFHEWGPNLNQQHNHCDWSMQQLDGSDMDEFRKRDASGAAQYALNIAKFKRERAQRLLCRADLAIHRAVVALMTAEAIKASSEAVNGDSI